MEVIIGIIVVALVIWVVVHIVFPIAGILAVAALGIGVFYALYVSLKSFFASVVEHNNPYLTYIDNNTSATGAKRGYFFGPGYHQIAEIVSGAFFHQKEHMDNIGNWKDRFVGDHSGMWFLNIWVYLFFFSSFLFVYVFGSVWVSAFSIVLCCIILGGMTFFFILFSLLWLSDRIYLLAHSIQSRCPDCKRISIVPLFECDGCGQLHSKLTPGPYGSFHRKCSCGKRLPTTIFNGRSALKAYCPYDQVELASGGARQFGIQLVGSTNSGKTTYLAAFWHEYLDSLRQVSSTSFRCFPQDAFDELEAWFQYGMSSSTNNLNSQMYSVIFERTSGIAYQMTIYDVAGEIFRSFERAIQQQQFKYCEGFLIIIDPTATADEADSCIAAFSAEFKKIRGIRASAISNMPTAVIISKSDLFKKEIGLPKIQVQSRQCPDSESMTPDEAFASTRDKLCREFLENHGFKTTLALLEGEFTNLCYFPVSSMGHEPRENTPYSPWGVRAPVDWILKQSKALNSGLE